MGAYQARKHAHLRRKAIEPGMILVLEAQFGMYGARDMSTDDDGAPALAAKPGWLRRGGLSGVPEQQPDVPMDT